MLVVGAAIIREGKCLVAKRSAQMRAPGKWEFPGGKVEEGETPRDALAREIAEELGVVIAVGDHLGQGVAGEVVLEVYAAELVSGQPHAAEHEALAWIGPEEAADLVWAEPDIPIIPALCTLLAKKL